MSALHAAMATPTAIVPRRRRSPNVARGRRGVAALAAGLLLLAAGSAGAHAEGAGAHAEGMDVEFDGRLRYRNLLMTDFPLDADGFGHDQNERGTGLVRASWEARFPHRIRIHLQLEFLDGQLYGTDSFVGGDAVNRPRRRVDLLERRPLRQAWFQIPLGIGVLRAGRTTSQWGLGMVANDGEPAGRDDGSTPLGFFERYPFADVTHGDVVNRALFVTRPLAPLGLDRASEAVELALGVDQIEEDDLADRREGDDAWQVVGALRWAEEALEAGIYVAHRDLTRPDGRSIRATAWDVYGRWDSSPTSDLELRLTGEAALLSGETDVLRFEGAPEPLDILQYGAVLRTGLRHAPSRLAANLELGLASGDGRPRDGTLRAFRFDPAYKAGMILFQEVLGRTSARAHDRVTDPDLQGEPPVGADRLPTQGAVHNAVYLAPRLRWQGPREVVGMQLGGLLAFAAEDLVDPYASALEGGYNANPWGRLDADGALGYELHAGLDARLAETEGASFRMGVQWGMLVPGPALDSGTEASGLGTVHRVRFLTDASW